MHGRQRAVRSQREYHYVRGVGTKYLKRGQRDPYEMVNYLGEDASAVQPEYTLAGRHFKHVVSRLDSLLMVLKSCKAKECHEPWETLHPGGKIRNLEDALHSSFDVFYQKQPKVSFSSCQLGYLIDEEGPQHVNEWAAKQAYQNTMSGGRQYSFMYHGHWSLWT